MQLSCAHLVPSICLFFTLLVKELPDFITPCKGRICKCDPRNPRSTGDHVHEEQYPPFFVLTFLQHAYAISPRFNSWFLNHVLLHLNPQILHSQKHINITLQVPSNGNIIPVDVIERTRDKEPFKLGKLLQTLELIFQSQTMYYSQSTMKAGQPNSDSLYSNAAVPIQLSLYPTVEFCPLESSLKQGKVFYPSTTMSQLDLCQINH